jgi:hypothetical protein
MFDLSFVRAVFFLYMKLTSKLSIPKLYELLVLEEIYGWSNVWQYVSYSITFLGLNLPNLLFRLMP